MSVADSFVVYIIAPATALTSFAFIATLDAVADSFTAAASAVVMAAAAVSPLLLLLLPLSPLLQLLLLLLPLEPRVRRL